MNLCIRRREDRVYRGQQLSYACRLTALRFLDGFSNIRAALFPLPTARAGVFYQVGTRLLKTWQKPRRKRCLSSGGLTRPQAGYEEPSFCTD
jgi:hypothetical protein